MEATYEPRTVKAVIIKEVLPKPNGSLTQCRICTTCCNNTKLSIMQHSVCLCCVLFLPLRPITYWTALTDWSCYWRQTVPNVRYEPNFYT